MAYCYYVLLLWFNCLLGPLGPWLKVAWGPLGPGLNKGFGTPTVTLARFWSRYPYPYPYPFLVPLRARALARALAHARARASARYKTSTQKLTLLLEAHSAPCTSLNSHELTHTQEFTSMRAVLLKKSPVTRLAPRSSLSSVKFGLFGFGFLAWLGSGLAWLWLRP